MAATTPYWTYILGPFVGSILAFGLARLYDANRVFKERLAAGNLALMVLKNQYDDFALLRRSFHDDCNRPSLEKGAPEWMLVRPNFIVYGEYEFDYEAISFLYENGAYIQAFAAIEEMQIKHRDIVQMDKLRTETTRKTQQLIADASKDKPLDVQSIVSVLGPALIAELDMLAVGLAVRSVKNEESYLRAFRTLREALRDYITQTWRYRVGYLFRFRHEATVEQFLVQLRPRLNSGFNTDELPELPANLRERVNDFLGNRKSGSTHN